MLLWARGAAIHSFPAPPSGWPAAEFQGLLAAGLVVSARAGGGRPHSAGGGQLRNISTAVLTREIWFHGQSLTACLQPDEERAIQWPR